MSLLRAHSVILLFALGPGTLLASMPETELPPATGTQSGDEMPCLVDERLSLLLGLEALDRTIAALDEERRELLAESSALVKSLEILDDVPRDHDSVDRTMARLKARTEGEEKIVEQYYVIDERITEIESTLQRRRQQRALLEARLEQLPRDPPSGRPES